MIGLSGLITPSLDEMMHVAREMTRQGFTQPLLIGGATTSRVHTAVKIAQFYPQGGVVHVLDASRAVGVLQHLVGDDNRAEYLEANRREQQAAREAFANKRRDKCVLPLDEARRRRTPIDWEIGDLAVPSFVGVHAVEVPLQELIPFIDWTPFFITWELHGKYPALFDDAIIGERARELFADAQELLAQIAREKQLTARGVYGFFPANAVGDDVEVYTDESRTTVRETLHFLRQQSEKREGEPNKSLADFLAPKETGLPDYIGGFAVTTGIGADELVRHFKAENDDYNAIMVSALADRLAEAFAEYLHARARRDWGYGADEKTVAGRPDTGKVPGDSTGSRLSRLPRPHGKARAIPAVGCRNRDGNYPHRKHGDAPGIECQRLVSGASAGRVFQRRQNRARSGHRLSGPQGNADG